MCLGVFVYDFFVYFVFWRGIVFLGVCFRGFREEVRVCSGWKTGDIVAREEYIRNRVISVSCLVLSEFGNIYRSSFCFGDVFIRGFRWTLIRVF